jgi:hypothetical protein
MIDTEWDEFCNLTIKGEKCLDGEFAMPDGRRFATYGTMWGDGLYLDQYDNKYSVDAGLIGCIRVEDINPEKLDGLRLGTVHEFDTDFVTGGGRGSTGWSGVIQFGRVAIETNPDYDDEDYDCDNDD